MNNRPGTPHRPRRRHPSFNQETEQDSPAVLVTPLKTPRSAADIAKFKECLRWQKSIPSITKENAILLSASNSKLNTKLRKLPLFLLVKISGYLCAPNKPGQPLEWLIISALFQSYRPKPCDQTSMLLDETEQKLILQTMFTTLFAKSCSSSSISVATDHVPPLATKALNNEAWLLDVVKKESSNLICASATRAAVALTDNDNENQLSMVMLFGTYTQKNMMIYYLIDTLFDIYCDCNAAYEKPNAQTEHLQAYKETSRYVTFMQQYKTQQWVNSLHNTPEEKSFENLLKIRHSGYFWNGEKTLSDKAPPSPYHAATILTNYADTPSLMSNTLVTPLIQRAEPDESNQSKPCCSCTIC